MDPAAEPDAPAAARDETLLVVEALVPPRAEGEPLAGGAREQVLAALLRAFPSWIAT